jgi:hypothetical protein
MLMTLLIMTIEVTKNRSVAESHWLNTGEAIIRFNILVLTTSKEKCKKQIAHPDEKWHNSIFMGYYWLYIQTNYW